MTRLRSHLPLITVLVVITLGGFAINHFLPSIDIQKALKDVSDALGKWTYALVGVAAFAETGAFVGLVLPGETFVILGGAVAGQGGTSILLTIAIVWLCAWGGDSASFLIGRRLGRDFIRRHGPKVRITEERFAKVEDYFRRWGGWTILIGRFIGLVRALAPFSAGSSGMRYRDFLPFSVLGTGAWATVFCLVGYFASRSLDRAAKIAGRGTLLFAITVALIVGVVALVRFLRVPDNRQRVVVWMEGHAAGRPLLALGRRLRPGWEFAAARLSPGGLGLELTAALAIAAVGSFVVVAYAITFADSPGPTAGDTTAFHAASHLRTDWLVHVAKVVTALGSSAVVVPLAAIAGGVLAVRRRWAELAVLVAGIALTLVGVTVIKDVIDRPRPSDPLTGFSGSSYPSGHSAHAIVYPWLAFVAGRVLGRGWRWHTVALVAGIVLALLVGLSRVYLHVHYLSDVSGGWGLGATAFALSAAVALVVIHLRQNPLGDASPRGPSD